MNDIIRPQNAITETIAKIKIEGNILRVIFPERVEKFRQILKSKDFQWDGASWYREIGMKAGKIEDRAAEIGNLLLNEGFVIQIADETIRNNAINAIYEDEKTRWITVYKDNSYADYVVISWRYNDDLYYKAQKLPASKYRNGNIIVRKEQYEAILDFAKMYDVAISKKAMQRLELAKQENLAALIPTAIKKKVKAQPQLKEERDGIDPSLLDD
nr:MAG TPA: hypothetical protein [Caudoviricetes sp.]